MRKPNIIIQLIVFKLLVAISMLLAMFLVASVATAQASIAFVQGADSGLLTASAPTAARSFTSSNTANDTIVVWVRWGDKTQSASVVDTQGNIYNAVGQLSSSAHSGAAEMFYAAGIKAGSNVVTANFSGSVGNRAVLIHEYAGTLSFDNKNQDIDNMTLMTSSVVVTSINDLVFVGIDNVSANVSAFTAGANYTARESDARDLSEDGTASVVGNYAAVWSGSSGSDQIVDQIVAFKVSDAPAPTPTPTSSPTPTSTPTLDPLSSTPPGPSTISATNCPQPAICSKISCPTSTNWVNPLAQGAKGDGTTDDSSAIRTASDVGDVCFPAGHTFLVNSSLSISSDNKHWQAASGGTPAVIKNTDSTYCNGIGCATVVINGVSGTSIIGLDFEGSNTTPPQWNNYPQGYNDAISGLGTGLANTLIVGNTFNAWFGQAELEFYANSCNSDLGNVIEYNTFKNCGLYGAVLDNFQNVSIHDNTSTDCSGGQENDNNSGCAGGNVWNHETVDVINGHGYRDSMCTVLTGGAAAGANYSGNLVENSSVSGSSSCLWMSVVGGTSSNQATYTNDTCTNGCQTK
jgi:hypothetical protein